MRSRRSDLVIARLGGLTATLGDALAGSEGFGVARTHLVGEGISGSSPERFRVDERVMGVEGGEGTVGLGKPRAKREEVSLRPRRVLTAP